MSGSSGIQLSYQILDHLECGDSSPLFVPPRVFNLYCHLQTSPCFDATSPSKIHTPAPSIVITLTDAPPLTLEEQMADSALHPIAAARREIPHRGRSSFDAALLAGRRDD